VNGDVSVSLGFGSARRFAFRARPRVIQALISVDLIGAYILLRDGHPIYIGRSDTCLRSRLINHGLLTACEHVVWQICASPQLAFHQEAACFHELSGTPGCLNRIHPARPWGQRSGCPFCLRGVRAAVLRALGRLDQPG
jgi:hypothetical protein